MTFETTIVTSAAPLLLILVGLLFTVIADKYIRPRYKRIMALTIAAVATLIANDTLDYLFTFVRSDPVARMFNSMCEYILLPVLIVLVHHSADGGKKLLPAWCLMVFNTAVYLVTPFWPVAFEIRPDNTFVRGPLGFTCHIVSALLFANLLWLMLHRSRQRKVYSIIPIFCVVLIAGSVTMDMAFAQSEQMIVSYLTIAVVMCCILFYSWFHLQFVSDYQEDVAARQRIRIMISQIQPHFLYNTIATFRALCKRDPDKAAEVAEKFGLYLRQNLDSLDTDDLIPFEKELEHTRVYADIEMVRFENVRVVYDILDSGFSLPPLTLQPLVENAIRHGVRGREEGRVHVRARFLFGYHTITVIDNGVGFDAAAAASTDRTHIGIKNVRERIETMCGGTLTIESVKGKGTTVTIRIPVAEGK